MASKGLPSGAILTTINGRRCTGIPKSSTRTTNHGTTTTSSSTSTTTTSSSTTSTTTSASSTTSTTLLTSTTSTTSTTSPTTALVAAPAADADESTALAEQSSTSTLSSSLVITTTAAITPGPAQVAPAQDSEAAPAPVATSLLAAPPTPSAATFQSFTVLADITPSQVSVSAAQSSQTDGSVTAPAAGTVATSAAADTADTTAPPLLPEGPAASPLLSTIESPQTTSNAVAAEATGTTPTNPASLNTVPAVNSNAVQSTVAVAGGVIGGVVAISVLAFFIWWWRRRMVKKRRSTLLTPLDAVPSADRNEKGGYVISRGSIGPTPVTEKVKAALGQNFKKFRSHIRNKTAPSVNLDRGPSQFMDTPSTRSRANSSVFNPEPTAKGRLLNWWSGLTGALKLNRRIRDVREGDSRVTAQRRTSSQPDFLTLLNMDDRELDRETQRQRASLGRLKGSASSTDNFLGGLNLNFGASLDDNPFSDANAIAHTSAKPAPLAVGGNPFSDANAIRDPSGTAPTPPKPATYVANIRRSRTNSNVGGGRAPSTLYYGTNNRDSIGSLRSLATATTTNQRTKFRSDPFDLERPELLGNAPALPPILYNNNNNNNNNTIPEPTTTSNTSRSNNNNYQTPRRPSMSIPTTAAAAGGATAESFTSRYSSKYMSKYSSGVSAVSSLAASDGWSDDPGPDVGPAAARYTPSPEPEVTVGNGTRNANVGGTGTGTGKAGARVSGGSLGSLGSVGKAM